MTQDSKLLLGHRDGLPDALQALLDPIARSQWEAHPEFGSLTRFWLDRHLSFRRVLKALQTDLETYADRRMSDGEYAARLSHAGGLFLQEMQGHHSIEDHVYFPKMVSLAPDLSEVFELLDSDHHQLHDELEGFATTATGVLQKASTLVLLEQQLLTLDAFLDRHLTDEEDVIVPVILRLGEQALG